MTPSYGSTVNRIRGCLRVYTDVAIGLGLPGANRGADHESNYVQVRRWLGKTGELNPDDPILMLVNALTLG